MEDEPIRGYAGTNSNSTREKKRNKKFSLKFSLYKLVHGVSALIYFFYILISRKNNNLIQSLYSKIKEDQP